MPCIFAVVGFSKAAIPPQLHTFVHYTSAGCACSEMERSDKKISPAELKRLLVSITTDAVRPCFRYRLLGEMWQSDFMRVVIVKDDSLILNDQLKNRLVAIRDLKSIMQFELDGALQSFQPHFHYDVACDEAQPY
jgi:hypothetical protein